MCDGPAPVISGGFYKIGMVPVNKNGRVNVPDRFRL